MGQVSKWLRNLWKGFFLLEVAYQLSQVKNLLRQTVLFPQNVCVRQAKVAPRPRTCVGEDTVMHYHLMGMAWGEGAAQPHGRR